MFSGCDVRVSGLDSGSPSPAPALCLPLSLSVSLCAVIRDGMEALWEDAMKKGPFGEVHRIRRGIVPSGDGDGHWTRRPFFFSTLDARSRYPPKVGGGRWWAGRLGGSARGRGPLRRCSCVIYYCNGGEGRPDILGAEVPRCGRNSEGMIKKPSPGAARKAPTQGGQWAPSGWQLGRGAPTAGASRREKRRGRAETVARGGKEGGAFREAEVAGRGGFVYGETEIRTVRPVWTPPRSDARLHNLHGLLTSSFSAAFWSLAPARGDPAQVDTGRGEERERGQWEGRRQGWRGAQEAGMVVAVRCV